MTTDEKGTAMRVPPSRDDDTPSERTPEPARVHRQMPNSPAPTACPCASCVAEAGVSAWWMIVCDECGNKRCPHGTDHRHECTGSNEPGQVGSGYARMTSDAHIETITDRATIRATDEPDPFRRNPVRRTGPDDPWRFPRFVADDHECVIVRDEYDEPAPFGSCSTHRRALSSPVALGCTTPAPVGAGLALNLDAIEARQKAAASARWEIIGDRDGPRALMALLGEDVPALVAEVATLRARLAAVEAEKEAILGQVGQAARMLRLTGAIAASQTVIAQVRRWPQFVDAAALATTGEVQ